MVGEVVVLDPDCDCRFVSLSAVQPQHPGSAADTHIFSERDFRGHHEGHVNGLPLGEREVGPDQGAARTEVLRKTGAAA